MPADCCAQKDYSLAPYPGARDFAVFGKEIIKNKKKAKTTDKQNESRKQLFESKPVPLAVMTLVVPTVISQILTIIYNFADTWFVGRTNNEAAVAAVSVAMPLFIVMTGLANLFGIGGASVISRSLGAGRNEDARRAFSFALWGGVAAAVVYSAVIYFFGENLISLIGGDENSHKYIVDYMFWTIVVGGVPTLLSALFGHLVRSVGKARVSGLVMSLGALLNIALDPLFMFVILPKGYEVVGAALATMLSNTVSAIVFAVYIFRSKDDVFTLNPKDFSPGGGIATEVLATGAPACLSTCLAMVSNIAANKLMSDYGTAAVAGLGIAKKSNTLAFNINMGLTQGVLPLVGYTYAAKNYSRMKKTVVFTFCITIAFSLACTFVYRTFPEPIMKFFIDEPETVGEGIKLLPTLAIAVVFCAMTYLMNTIFQATGKKLYSLITSIMRKGVFDIPLMFVFKKFLDETGIVMATPTAEILSIFVSLFLLIKFLKSLKNPPQNA